MIKVEVETPDTDKLVARFDSWTPRLQASLREGMKRIVFQLAAYVQKNKLSGQSLTPRTGTLRRSIKGMIKETAASVTGVVGSRDRGNDPLKYAGYHELGFHGRMDVREHLRHLASGTIATVRAHARNVSYTGHPYLRPSLAENQGMVQKELFAAINKVTNNENP